MAENSFGDFFLSDAEDETPSVGLERREPSPGAPVPPAPAAPVTPQPEPAPAPASSEAPAVPPPAPVSAPVPAATPVPEAVPVPAAATEPPAPVTAPANPASPEPPAVAEVPPAVPSAPTSGETREQRLADALDRLMEGSPDVQAAALVSLDGFTMASALPAGMQEDRVGAMSAAILGLGERAALELGRGKLSQVFIQGEGGYVLLIAAGTRSVLTCLADEDAKLGLLLYDMRAAADAVGEILG